MKKRSSILVVLIVALTGLIIWSSVSDMYSVWWKWSNTHGVILGLGGTSIVIILDEFNPKVNTVGFYQRNSFRSFNILLFPIVGLRPPCILFPLVYLDALLIYLWYRAVFAKHKKQLADNVMPEE